MKESLKIIILLLVVLSLVIFIIYIWKKINKKRQSVFSSTTSTATESCSPHPAFDFNSLLDADTSNSVQTEFFKDSADYALKIVKGDEPICSENLCENSQNILNALKCMDEGEKANVYIGIQYMLISKQDLEEQIRQMSNREEVPMWILFIREAMIRTGTNMSNSPLSVSYCKTA